MSECAFCRKIANDGDEHGPVQVVLGYPLIYRFAPLNPVTNGHMLFVPAEHIIDAAEHPMVAGHCFAAAASHGFLMAEAFNLITSAGDEATQTVKHLHIHYVPRRANDGLLLPWSKDPWSQAADAMLEAAEKALTKDATSDVWWFVGEAINRIRKAREGLSPRSKQ